MIVVCPKCSSQIQVGGSDTKRPPSIRCPKCNTTLNAVAISPASEKSALAVSQSPSTDQHRFKTRAPAPLFEGEKTAAPGVVPTAATPMEEMGRLLASLLRQQQQGVSATQAAASMAGLSPRKALVCSGESHREIIARQLAEKGYQVFVARDTGQAVDRMRENQLDVVILDPEFDFSEQGAAFVTREVKVLRPAQRRRLFFVLLSPLLRTMDAHTAFLNNANAIVNFKEVGDLFGIIEHALKEYNELYKDFNKALNVTAL